MGLLRSLPASGGEVLGETKTFGAGGLPPRSMLWVQYNGGIDVESDYPYHPKSPTPGMCDLLKEGDKEVSIDEVITGVPFLTGYVLHPH